MFRIRNGAFGGDSGLHNPDVDNQGLDSMNNNTAADYGDADDEGDTKEASSAENGNTTTTTTRSKDGSKGVKDNTKKDGSKGAVAKGKKIVKKPAKKPAQSLEDKFKIPQLPKVPTPPPMKYPQRGDKELGEDTASVKDKKRREIEELKAELRKAKNARVDMEKEREAKVRRAKMLQNQMMQKRNQCKCHNFSFLFAEKNITCRSYTFEVLYQWKPIHIQCQHSWISSSLQLYDNK